MFVINAVDGKIQVTDFTVYRESGVLAAQRPDGRVLTLSPGSWSSVEEVEDDDGDEDEPDAAVEAFAGP